MKQIELAEHLGISRSRFYQLRISGVIPSPTSGSRLRKFYSEAEIAAIKKKLKAEGVIR